jgi:isoleucyl-tRNA synthetase
VCTSAITASRTDTSLEADFEVVRQVVKMGRALREKYRLKTRQPLRDVTVVTHDAKERAAMLKHAELIQQELNVKEVRVVEDDNALCTLVFKANFKTLGKRMGQRMKGFADAIAQFGRVEWDELSAGRPVMVDDEAITADDVTVSRVASVGVVVETSGSLTVALETKLDQALLDEGMMREVVSQLQKLRKDSDFDVTDRVVVEMVASDDGLRAALSTFEAHIASEVLATDIKIVGQEAWGAKLASAVTHDLMIDELSLKVRIAKV